MKYRFRKTGGRTGTVLRYVCLAAAVLAAALAGAGRASGGTAGTPAVIEQPEQPGSAVQEIPETRSGEDPAEDAYIYIYVCGQVRSPDVYRLPGGSRAYEAVEAAGGLTGEAAPESVEMAAVLSDAVTLYIPSREEAERYGTGEIPGGRQTGGISGNGTGSGRNGTVDINRADASELASLPGIGDKRAAAIIEYREKNGRFTDVTQLKQVSGIGEAVFAGLKDLIRVGE